MSLVRNERLKLFANALDRASTACITVGVFGPAVAFLYGLGGASGVASSFLAVGSALWLVGAAMLHLIAQFALGKLR